MAGKGKSAGGLRGRDLAGIVFVIVMLSLSLVALASQRPARAAASAASVR